MKKLIATVALITPLYSLANVTCTGVPERIFAGAHGGNGAGGKYWVVLPGWKSYSIGTFDSDAAKSRYSMAMTAMVAGKKIEMSFYSHTTCEQAISDQAIPTAMSIVK